MRPVLIMLAMVALACAAFPACDDGSDGDADSDSDVDSDGDADSDSDTDTDTDTDIDGDADGDTDGDTDGDVDGDTDGDIDGDVDGDIDGDADGDGDAGECDSIAAVRAAATGRRDRRVDFQLCGVLVTYVTEDAFFIQEGPTGPAIRVFEGSGRTPDVEAGDEVSLQVIQVTDYRGNEEINGHGLVEVESEGNPLDGYVQDLTPGIHPNEELESELVRVTGATVTAVARQDVVIRYGTASDVAVRTSAERLVCVGATIDLVSVVTYWEPDDAYRIQSFDPSDFTRIDLGGCGAGGRDPLPGDLVINEFMSDPPGSAAEDVVGDANCDGVRNGTQDEFIELVNVTTDTLDLSDVTIADSVEVRYQFDLGASLPAGHAAVVFGGGDLREFCAWPGGVRVFALDTPDGLGLSNSGDESIIVAVRGDEPITIARHDFTASAGFDQSLTLNPDLNDTDATPYLVDGFVRHSTVAPEGELFSPGTQIDGSPFPVSH